MPKYVHNVDLSQNELQNAVIQNLATAPGTPVEGQVYYNTGDDTFYIRTTAGWEPLNGADMVFGGAATIINPDDTAAAGVSTGASRSDHVHGIVAAAPSASLSAATTNAEGAATSFARSDHSHAITANVAAGSIQPDDTAAVGTSASLARADHKHSIVASAPTGSLGTGSSNAEGVATSFARSDHSHDIADDYLLNNGDTFTGNLSSNGTATITNLPDPTNPGDAANKGYVDEVAQGLDAKESVVAATTGNITLSGTQTIDGVSVVAGERVLVKNQSTTSQNGIYVVASGAWTRAEDNNEAGEFAGAFVFVEEGTANADSGWVCTTDEPVTVGTTAIAWTQFSGAGSIEAGAGLTKTGSTIDVVAAAGSGLIVNTDNIDVDWGEVGDIAVLNPDETASAGVLNEFARADHAHNVPAAAPTTTHTLATANAEGASTSFARADHTHALDKGEDADVVGLTANSTNTIGANNEIAGAGHTHALDTTNGTISTVNAGDTALEGTGTGLSRRDHRHAVATAAPSTTLTLATTNAEGTSTSLARADHTHAISQFTGTPSAVATTGSAGSSANVARGDHTHAGLTRHAEAVGNGTNTSFTVTHNFNTRDVIVQVFEAATPWEQVYADVVATTLNAVDVSFSVAPTASQYRVVVIG